MDSRQWWQPRTLRRETATVLLCQVLFWGLMFSPSGQRRYGPASRDFLTVGEHQIKQVLEHHHYLASVPGEISRAVNAGDWLYLATWTINPLLTTASLLIIVALALQLLWLWVPPRPRRWLWDVCGLPCLGLFLLFAYSHFVSPSVPSLSLSDRLVLILIIVLFLAVAVGGLAFGHLGRLLFKPRRQPQPSPPQS
ncbi:MAG: hypothetical protein AAGK14_05345 [Verrucomicrobiota bacterium]